MRLILALLAPFLLSQCLSPGGEQRFAVGQSQSAYVIIGVAESADEREPAYTLLWRLLDGNGAFSDYGDRRIFEPRTNANDTVRIDGIPGEFSLAEVEPGVYALDSVFAVLSENGLKYFAQGLVHGPLRPAFEVRAGEAVFLGIWETRIADAYAETRLWRLSAEDMEAVVRAAQTTKGAVELREIGLREVACTPHRLSNNSQRQIC